jgi:hypothetical protein
MSKGSHAGLPAVQISRAENAGINSLGDAGSLFAVANAMKGSKASGCCVLAALLIVTMVVQAAALSEYDPCRLTTYMLAMQDL